MAHEFELITREFELVTRAFELVTRGFELVTRRVELITRGFELEARVLLFHYNSIISVFLFNCMTFLFQLNFLMFC